MALPRFSSKLSSLCCTRDLSIARLSRGGHSYMRIGPSQAPPLRTTCNTQALRLFSTTFFSSKPQLRCMPFSEGSLKSKPDSKRSYAYNRDTPKAPLKTQNPKPPPPPPPNAQPQPQPQQQHPQEESDPPPPRLHSSTPLIGGIIATCIIVYTYQAQSQSAYRTHPTRSTLQPLQTYNDHMVTSQRNIDQGRYWTLITSAFSHSSILHLGVNMYVLWGFGPPVIAAYGAVNFLTLYLGSAAAGSVAQLWWWKKHPPKDGSADRSVGASAAISGLLSVVACAMPYTKVALLFIPIPIPIRQAIMGMVGFSLGALQFGWLPDIGHAAHLGGLAFGGVAWALALRRRPLGYHFRLGR